jgi:hypothetical protein
VPSFPQIATTILIGATALGAVACGIWWSADDAGLLEYAEDGETSSPRIQLVSDEQNLGRVPVGRALQVSFCIANTGAQPLELRHFRSQYSEDQESSVVLTVEPGRVGELAVELNADALLPSGVRHVRFRTNDPARPDLWLTIRGIVGTPAPPATYSESTP